MTLNPVFILLGVLALANKRRQTPYVDTGTAPPPARPGDSPLDNYGPVRGRVTVDADTPSGSVATSQSAPSIDEQLAQIAARERVQQPAPLSGAPAQPARTPAQPAPAQPAPAQPAPAQPAPARIPAQAPAQPARTPTDGGRITVVSDTIGPSQSIDRRAQETAAWELYTIATTTAAVSRDHNRVRELQRIMGSITADGLIGRETNRRVRELIGRAIPGIGT